MGILDDVVVNAKSAAESVGKTAGRLVDVSKLKISISEVNSEITKRFQALGEYIYENHREDFNGDVEFAGKISELDELATQKESLLKDLMQLQNRTICPNCGKHSPAEFTFCSACGTKLATEPPIAPVPPAPEEPQETPPTE